MTPKRQAFSLVELVVVVMILAILAAIAVPQFLGTRGRASTVRAAQDLRVIEQAVLMYYSAYNEWPVPKPVGVVPNGMSEFIKDDVFLNPTPLGGAYRLKEKTTTSAHTGSVTLSGVAIRWSVEETAPLDLCLGLDELIDDGDLRTGRMLMPDKRLLMWVQDSTDASATGASNPAANLSVSPSGVSASVGGLSASLN